MERRAVELIFEQNKDLLVKHYEPQEKPTAFLLGGQPASGKSSLQSDPSVLGINGDLYRVFHPDFARLLLDPQTYSKETQIFSNVFTERMIEEVSERRLNVSIEGTMRNKKVPESTAEYFHKKGYRVVVKCIAAPGLFTGINAYYRYAEEIAVNGYGRLADMDVHDEAVAEIPHTLDYLYDNKIVDEIQVYDLFGRNEVGHYKLLNGEWDLLKKPGEIIEETRENRLKQLPLAAQFIERANQTMRQFREDDPIREQIEKRSERLSKWVKDNILIEKSSPLRRKGRRI